MYSPNGRIIPSRNLRKLIASGSSLFTKKWQWQDTRWQQTVVTWLWVGHVTWSHVQWHRVVVVVSVVVVVVVVVVARRETERPCVGSQHFLINRVVNVRQPTHDYVILMAAARGRRVYVQVGRMTWWRHWPDCDVIARLSEKHVTLTGASWICINATQLLEQ